MCLSLCSFSFQRGGAGGNVPFRIAGWFIFPSLIQSTRTPSGSRDSKMTQLSPSSKSSHSSGGDLKTDDWDAVARVPGSGQRVGYRPRKIVTPVGEM